MLFGSPSGVALSTQKSVHIASDAQTNLVSGQSTHIATGKSLIASVAEKLSLFVQNAGMKLFAAKGKVEIQAHSDNIELTAQKTVKVLSATESIEAAAKQEILLTSGGAYIRIKDGNIEIHAPGKIDIKGSQHSFNGPASMSYALPSLPLATLEQKSTQEYSQTFHVSELLDHPLYAPALSGQPYRIYMPDDSIQQQGMLINGATDTVRTPTATKVRCEIGAGDWVADEHAYDEADIEAYRKSQSAAKAAEAAPDNDNDDRTNT